MRRLKEFYLLWKEEIWGMPIAILLWYTAPIWLRWLDPTAAVLDAGVLQIILFAIIAFLAFKTIAWISIACTFPEVFRFRQKYFRKSFYHLNNTQKIVLCVSIYCFYLFVLSLLVQVL